MQLSLFSTKELLAEGTKELVRATFSHHNIAPQQERVILEEKYAHLLEESDKFNRRLVSYQGNKNEIVHGWIKYREGFSAQLVEDLIREFGLGPDDTVLDPFSGSATTLLVAKALGIDALGVELLPVCHLSWQAKSRFLDYQLTELKYIQQQLVESQPRATPRRFPHLKITAGGFTQQAENDVMFYTGWFEQLPISEPARVLTRLLLVSILEEVSYTRKDGQYLRWDYRSPKIEERNRRRVQRGEEPIKQVDLGPFTPVKEALIRALAIVLQRKVARLKSD